MKPRDLDGHGVYFCAELTRVDVKTMWSAATWLAGTFEGCSCERDLEGAVSATGFASVDVENHRIRTPFVPFNTHIAGIARA
jgi:hypothetical protein